MKIIGLLFFGAAIFVFGRDKVKRNEERLLVLEELHRFIEYMRVEVGCYLRPPALIAERFSSEILSSTGFLSDLRKDGLIRAYENLYCKIGFSESENKLLREFFSSFGRNFTDGELDLIDRTSVALKTVIMRERENAPKYKKLIVALSCAFVFSVTIVLI